MVCRARVGACRFQEILPWPILFERNLAQTIARLRHDL